MSNESEEESDSDFPSRVRNVGPFKPISNRKPPEAYAARIQELHGASDRVCAIVWGVEVQDHLARAVHSVLIKHREHTDVLVAFDGPLGNFRLLNDLAHTIGLISQDVWYDIDCIREIRNAFAHNVTLKHSDRRQRPITFDSDKVEFLGSSLNCPEQVLRPNFTPEIVKRLGEGPKILNLVPCFPPPVRARERFEWTCSVITMLLSNIEYFDEILVSDYGPSSYQRQRPDEA